MRAAEVNVPNDDWFAHTREYRVMHTAAGTFEIREVYFDANGDVCGWTGHAASLWGVSDLDLRGSIPVKLAALNRPVLVETDLPNYTANVTDDLGADRREGRPTDTGSGHDRLLLVERSSGYEEGAGLVEDCPACGAMYADARKHAHWHAQQPGERFDVSRHLTTCPYGQWIEQTPVGEFLGPCNCGVKL